jgi:catechol 2,3-dioxygenase-like lactoylglutathione lyase family enzyme
VTGLAEIAVFTDDVAAASAFYRGLLGDPVTEWPGGTLFALGGAKLLVHERAAALDDGPPDEDHFALSVEDLRGLRGTGRARAHPPRRGARLSVGSVRLPSRPGGRLVELAQA